MSHGHNHAGHDHGGPTPERALWVAVVLNAAFLVLEAAVGFYTNSLALLSDAGHMVSDVGALVVALIAIKLASRKPSGAYTASRPERVSRCARSVGQQPETSRS